PKASSQAVINAQAAYFVYGFGGTGGQLAPWTNDALIFSRGPSSSVQQMIAAAIKVPAAKWFVGASGSTLLGSAGSMVTNMSGSTIPEGTIGILSSIDADVSRLNVKVLAYQHYNQDCAWLPDSTSGSFDKINVRDGHYAIWGPMHFFAKVDASGAPMNP